MSSTSARVVDVDCLLINLGPVVGWEMAPVLPLRDTLSQLTELTDPGPHIEEALRAASIQPRQPEKSRPSLSVDQLAAIHLYTQEWSEAPSLYRCLNRALRSDDRSKVKPWFPFLKLLITALRQLPKFKGPVWRGLKKDVSAKYPSGLTFRWWPFSSCTTDGKASGLLPDASPAVHRSNSSIWR